MAQKKAFEVDSFLNSGQVGSFPLILLYGPDRGLIFERAKKIVHSSGLKLDEVFNLVSIDASEADSLETKILDEAYTISLFGDQRLIWIRHASDNAGLQRSLEVISKDFPPNVIILVEGGDLKTNSKLRLLVEKSANGIALPCYHDEDRSIDGLIDRYLAEYKLEIDREARYFLKSNLGGDRYASKSEIEKLCLYCLGDGYITLEAVQAVISDAANLSHDSVIEAVFEGNLIQAEISFDRFLQMGGNMIWLLSGLVRQFQQVQNIHSIMLQEDLSIKTAMEKIKPPIFYKKRSLVERICRYWQLKDIMDGLNKLQQLTLDIRKMPHFQEMLVRKLILSFAALSRRLSNRAIR